MYIDLTSLVTNRENTLKIDEYPKISEELLKTSPLSDLENIHLTGTIKKIVDEYEFLGQITGNMILPDDVTLEAVKIPININFDEIFAENDPNNENNLTIIQNRLDILPFLWQNIILEVPLKVRGNKKDIKLEGDGWRLITEEDLKTSDNSPFSNLQQMLDSRKE